MITPAELLADRQQRLARELAGMHRQLSRPCPARPRLEQFCDGYQTARAASGSTTVRPRARRSAGKPVTTSTAVPPSSGRPVSELKAYPDQRISSARTLVSVHGDHRSACSSASSRRRGGRACAGPAAWGSGGRVGDNPAWKRSRDGPRAPADRGGRSEVCTIWRPLVQRVEGVEELFLGPRLALPGTGRRRQ